MRTIGMVSLVLVVSIHPWTPLRGQSVATAIPPEEIIGVLVQFLAGDFGTGIEFVGDLRLQNISINTCPVTLFFGEGAGQPPSVPLLADGVPLEGDSLPLTLSPFESRVISITTSEASQLFRGGVLAQTSERTCASIVSFQGGYQIIGQGTGTQKADGEIVDIARVQPGTPLRYPACGVFPANGRIPVGFGLIGGPPFGPPVPGGAMVEIKRLNDQGSPVCTARRPFDGELLATTESALCGEDSGIGGMLKVCLVDMDYSAWILGAQFMSGLGGNVQTSGIGVDDLNPVCTPGPNTLCLNNNRFRATIDWRDFDQSGTGTGVEISDSDGYFYFFDPNNFEILVKVFDGCGFNDHFWVFANSETAVEYTLTVTDTVTAQTKTYENELGRPAPAVTDTTAFATCP